MTTVWTTNDATVAARADEPHYVVASHLGSANHLTFDGSAETNGFLVVYGGAGDDVITGGDRADTIYVGQGGNDIVNGAGGNDVFQFGATFTADDQVDGGTGNDKVWLNGDYSAGVTFTATTMVNVEKIAVAAGHDYSLTTNDATVAAGETLSVVASRLGSGNHLTFDGSAETDGYFIVYGGAGDDAITGGGRADRIHLGQGGNDTVDGGGGNDSIYMGGSLTADDRIDGGSGANAVYLDGTATPSVTFGATTMVNVQGLFLDGGHNYDLTTSDATVANGSFLEVDASQLTSHDSLTFDGSAETGGAFLIAGGAGNDNVTGGHQSDEIDMSAGGVDIVHANGGDDEVYMGSALRANDRINGGTGNDTVIFDGNYTGSHAIVLAAHTLNSVEAIELGSSHSYDITSNDATVAAGSFLIVDGSQLLAHDTVAFDGSAETDGVFELSDGLGNDTLIGGQQADFLSFDGGGTDKGVGGGGDDFIDACGHVDPTDQFDGGAGVDAIELTADETSTGNYTGPNALHFTGAMMQNFEQMDLDGGGSYDITTVDANVNAGVAFDVDGSDLLSTDTLRFDGSAETDGTFVFNMGGSFVAGDQLIGGAGNDALELSGDYSAGVTFAANTIASVETITLDAGGNYNLIADDGNVAAGATLTVYASALTLGDSVSFDGSAETDGSFAFVGGTAPGSVFIGGAQADSFDLTRGYAQVTGNGGADTFTLDASGDGQITYNGAAGFDLHVLRHDRERGFFRFADFHSRRPCGRSRYDRYDGRSQHGEFRHRSRERYRFEPACGRACGRCFTPDGGTLGNTGHAFLSRRYERNGRLSGRSRSGDRHHRLCRDAHDRRFRELTCGSGGAAAFVLCGFDCGAERDRIGDGRKLDCVDAGAFDAQMAVAEQAAPHALRHPHAFDVVQRDLVGLQREPAGFHHEAMCRDPAISVVHLRIIIGIATIRPTIVIA